MPIEVAEFERTRIWFNFDDARDGDGDCFDAATARLFRQESLEIFRKDFDVGGGVFFGGEFETLETKPTVREESE